MDAMLKPYFDGVGSHHNSHQITTFHTELYRSIPIVLKENHCKNRVYRCMPSFAGARDGNRTRTPKAADFKSATSTNFVTRAKTE